MNAKVLIIVENLPVPFDRRVWMEATTLRSAGCEVSVICPTGKGYEALREVIEGIHVYRHPLPPEVHSATGYFREYLAALSWEWKLARRAWRERRFDVIHACNPPDLIFVVAAWFKFLHGVKFVFDHHDLCPELYESKYNRRDLFYWALRLLERLTFGLADTVISTNESYRAVALRRGRKKPEHVHVVRSAPDLSKFNPTTPDPLFRRGRQYLVGYLGVMGPQDGLDHLLRAAHELVVNRGRKDIQFCLIGKGPMFEQLQQMARDLGVADCVEFTGRIPDAEMMARLARCDLCVNPDPLNPLNNVSTMNKIMEYMALGRPIVQYDLKEDRFSAGEASWYAEPNNVVDLAAKIEQLLADETERTKMGALGRKRMEDSLAWHHQAPRLLAAYQQTLGA
ncbi:MAG: glycosyltransferase family 4 protein [Verrucomicrobia bacterium]|nr:glycosyltransferase family 4 protein [Verrucomicrobiota bacterium]